MAVGEEEGGGGRGGGGGGSPKLDAITDEVAAGLVTMETVPANQDMGAVVGGMMSHNGLPGYSPPREGEESGRPLVGRMEMEEEEEEEEGEGLEEEEEEES